MAARHVPERTCVACGAKRPQPQFLRLASSAGQPPALDQAGKAPGRGAYVCRDMNCLEKAFQRRALERALKLNCGLSPSLKEELRAALTQMDQKESGEAPM